MAIRYGRERCGLCRTITGMLRKIRGLGDNACRRGGRARRGAVGEGGGEVEG